MNFKLLSFLLLFIGNGFISAQQKKSGYWDFNLYTGSIQLHNKKIVHLIKGHPNGFILSYNFKTHGNQNWEQLYGYPDYGISTTYQDLKNPILGHTYGLNAHYNFYFLNRNIMFRIAQGLAIISSPYDRVHNPKNIAFGSKILSSTYAMLNYKKENLWRNLGFQGGLLFMHFSNGNFKAPNTSINTISLQLGVTYSLNKQKRVYKSDSISLKFKEKLKFNFVFRSGINQSDVLGSEQYPFYIFSLYIDKRLNRKSAVHVGSEIFFSNFLKEHIKYQSIAFDELEVTGNEDFKRVGLFLGHELFINRLSVITQLGYYVYYPFDFEGRIYVRPGLKYYFTDHWFAALTLKSHGAKAEAVEWGIGIRF